VNKTDALGLVSNFGSVRTAVNARPEEVLMIAGWGQTKVKQWRDAVQEPFRSKKAAKRSLGREGTLSTQATISREASRPEHDHEEMAATSGGDSIPTPRQNNSPLSVANGTTQDAYRRPPKRAAGPFLMDEADEDEEDALREAMLAPSAQVKQKVAFETVPAAASPKKRPAEPEVSDGVLVALARLREQD